MGEREAKTRQCSKIKRHLFHRGEEKETIKKQGESWKFQWRRQCFARKEQRSAPAFRKLKRRVVNSTRFEEQSMHVSWRLMSPRDNVWNHLYQEIMKITSQAGRISIRWHTTIWCTSLFLMPQAMKNPNAKAAVETGMGEASTRLQLGSWTKVKSKSEVILEAQWDKKKVHFAALMDICHLKKCGVRTAISEV